MRNKRKGILMACSILGSAAIVSTGFAAWVITINDGDEVIGQIQVETVEDETIVLEASDLSTPAIRFGAVEKSIPEATKDWLSPKNGVETLSATITVNVTDGAEFCKGFAVSVIECKANGDAFGDGEKGPYALAYEQGYVAAMPTTGTVNYTAKAASGTVTIEFDWGDYFGGHNPTDFYNQYAHDAKRADAKTSGHTYSQDAASVLASTVFQNLNSACFKVIISPTR